MPLRHKVHRLLDPRRRLLVIVSFLAGYSYFYIFREKVHHSINYPPYLTNTDRANISKSRDTPGIPRTYHYDGQLLLFVAIFTAASFKDRRQAIRETWLRDCKPHKNIMCKFFTDRLDSTGNPADNKTVRMLERESSKNNDDLILVNSMSGHNFALRFLVVLDYAMRVTHFEYFLRIDDDHFPCLDRIVAELPSRPNTGLYWGWQHCAKG